MKVSLRRPAALMTLLCSPGKITCFARCMVTKLRSSLPLDIQATAFQRRVWTRLQSITPSAQPAPTQRDRKSDRTASNRDSRRRPRLRHEPSGRGHSLSPRGRKERRYGAAIAGE